jgi:hypothetical protein
MKQQILAAYHTASRHFIDILSKKVKHNPGDGIQTVLVPTERNRTSVCIIMKSGVFIFYPSKQYHNTKKHLQRPRKHKPITRTEHMNNCNRVMDKLLETYRQQALERLRKGYSRQLTGEEKRLLYAKRNREFI